MSKPTIDDVAKLAGVSMKTVSRVINSEPHVREALVTKVQAAIAELNYRPSQSARSLAGNRSYIIGLMYSNLAASYIIDVQKGALAKCHAAGYDLLIHPCDDQRSRMVEQVNGLLEKKVDGLILTPPIADMNSLLETLDARNVSYVRNSPMTANCSGLQVSCNEREAAREMTHYLISLGHKKIGFILGALNQSSAQERLEGYKEALREAGIEFRYSYTHAGDYSFELGKKSAEYLLDLRDRPTAIFASNDEMALGTMSVALAKGISIPDELTVVGFDDMPGARQSWPTLTTVRQPIIGQAELATQLLIASLQGKELPEYTPTLTCELVIRNSSAPCVEEY